MTNTICPVDCTHVIVYAGKGRRDSSRAAKPLRPPPKPRELHLTSRARADSDSSDEEEPPSEVRNTDPPASAFRVVNKPAARD